MGLSRENSLFAKNRGKAVHDKQLSPNPRKAGSLMHQGLPFLDVFVIPSGYDWLLW